MTSGILTVVLDSEQSSALAPVLDSCREQTGYEGIFATLCRIYSPCAGSTILELQVIRVPRSKAAKVKRLLAPEPAPEVSASEVLEAQDADHVQCAPQ